MPDQQQRRLAAIMFTDMVGYSALAQKDERRALALVEEQRHILRPICAKHGGKEIKTTGDGTLVEFDSALLAARCAVEVQRTLVERNVGLAPQDRIHIRVGLHVGDVVHKGSDILGDAVNIAARIEPLAEADGICVSEDVARQIEGKIEERIERMGRRELKNIRLPVVAYRIVLPWSRRKSWWQPRRTALVLSVLAAFIVGVAVGHYWKPHLGSSMRHVSAVRTLSFSPNGRLLASAGEDKTIRIWDVEKRREARRLSGHTRSVFAVAFSPDGKLVASGGFDRTVKLWDVATGREVRTLTGHTRAVNTVAFSPDGLLLASGGDDRTIILWDPSNGGILRKLVGHGDTVNSVAFSPDGHLLGSGSDDETIKIWDVNGGRELRRLAGHGDAVECVAFDHDGRWLASGSFDRMIKVWDPATGTEVRTLAGHTDAVVAVAFSSNGHLLASGSWDGTVRLWDPTTGEENGKIEAEGGSSVNSVAWGHSGLLAWGSDDGSIGTREYELSDTRSRRLGVGPKLTARSSVVLRPVALPAIPRAKLTCFSGAPILRVASRFWLL